MDNVTAQYLEEVSELERDIESEIDYLEHITEEITRRITKRKGRRNRKVAEYQEECDLRHEAERHDVGWYWARNKHGSILPVRVENYMEDWAGGREVQRWLLGGVEELRWMRIRDEGWILWRPLHVDA